MIILIAGVVLSLLMLIFSWKISIAVLAVTFILLFLPLEGYGTKSWKKIKLLPIDDPRCEEKKYFLIANKHKVVYAYDNSEHYDLSGTAYQTVTVRGKIKIYESQECTEPILKFYEKKPIRDEGFALALFGTRREYVFYVPKGTVIRNSK